MNTYQIITSNDRNVRIEAESFIRDGDWLQLTKSAPQMEPRRIEDPEAGPGQYKNIMVATGRQVQTPIALFYKPISVELIKEPANGNDA